MLLGNTAIRAIQKCYIQTLRVTRARILQAAVTILSAGWSVFRHLSCRICRHTGCYRLSMRYPRTWAEGGNQGRRKSGSDLRYCDLSVLLLRSSPEYGKTD